MHLICTDVARHDICTLNSCTLDMAFGDSENTFELCIPVGTEPTGLTFGSLIYADGTEYGGIVDNVGADTTGKIHKVVYSGRTWHGIIEHKTLRPDTGANHLTVSGEANAVMLQLIHRVGLADLFTVDASDSGIRVTYQFDRYITGYTGLRSMLATKGAKLTMLWDGGRVALSAKAAKDWTADEFDGRTTGLRMSLAGRPVNHLVCLGKGELRDRIVIDLYADEAGSISRTQTLFGLDENEEVYDYSSAGADELEEDGIKRLKECQAASTCDVPNLPTNDYDIGDIVGGRESRLGVFVTAEIYKKIVTVGRHGVTTSCEAGGVRMNRVTPAL